MTSRQMVSDDPFSDRHSRAHPPATPFRFSPEELRVLRECNRDAFYQRSLPLAALFSFGVYGGVKKGYLRPNATLGATPKIIFASILGYLLGKFSYQGVCAERIMRLPNSAMGEALRRRKYGLSGEGPTMDPGMVLTPFGSYDTYSDVAPTHDLDSDRPHMAGLDDYGRPSYDSNVFEEAELPAVSPSHSTTYEELRRKNREEYDQKRVKPTYRGPITDDAPSAPAYVPPPRSPSPEHLGPRGQKNVYGDIWEK